MRARPFLAVVLAVAVALLALAGVGWWLVLARSPLQLQHQALAMPLAARFVPRQAALSIYLFADGGDLEAYARAVAPGGQRRQAAAAMARLRDGAFAAAGLDYPSELASWLAPETAVALLGDRAGGSTGGDWLLSLRSRDAEGARRFVQRFWQTRSLAGTDVQVGTYRGMGVISGRGGLVGQPTQPLATALINNDLVLIASGRKVLEQALDVSQIDELNQASSPGLRAGLAQLGEGLALVCARDQALQQWFGAPAGVGPMVAALRPAGAGLAVEARFELAEPLPTLAAGGAAGTALLQGYRGGATSLALLQSPARWPQPLQGLLQTALAADDAGPLPALVSQADAGPLVWGGDAQGWRLGTPARSPDPQQLQPALKAQGLVEAPVDLQGQQVQVWTRLLARSGAPAASGSLEASVVGAHTSPAAVSTTASTAAPLWWARSLEALGAQLEQGQLPRARLAELEALPAQGALLRWSMAAGPAQRLLRGWQPWQLLSGLAARNLAEAVDGLSLRLGSAEAQLQLNAALHFD